VNQLSSRSTPKKAKTFLQKRSFLTDNKNDTSAIVTEVRRYEYGHTDASFRIATGSTDGFSIYCNPDSEESLKNTNIQIDSLISHLQEFKKAIAAASK
jgi:hypothetical protein